MVAITSISGITPSGTSAFQRMNQTISQTGTNATSANTLRTFANIAEPSLGNGSRLGSSQFQQNNRRIDSEAAQAVDRMSQAAQAAYEAVMNGTGPMQRLDQGFARVNNELSQTVLQQAQSAYAAATQPVPMGRGGNVDLSA